VCLCSYVCHDLASSPSIHPVSNARYLISLLRRQHLDRHRCGISWNPNMPSFDTTAQSHPSVKCFRPTVAEVQRERPERYVFGGGFAFVCTSLQDFSFDSCSLCGEVQWILLLNAHARAHSVQKTYSPPREESHPQVHLTVFQYHGTLGKPYPLHLNDM